MESAYSPVTPKLFIGCLITGEVRMHLNASEIWKQACLGIQTKENSLIQTRFEEHEYIGCFYASSLSLIDLRQAEAEVRNRLFICCPNLATERLKMVLFSQLFIS